MTANDKKIIEAVAKIALDHLDTNTKQIISEVLALTDIMKQMRDRGLVIIGESYTRSTRKTDLDEAVPSPNPVFSGQSWREQVHPGGPINIPGLFEENKKFTDRLRRSNEAILEQSKAAAATTRGYDLDVRLKALELSLEHYKQKGKTGMDVSADVLIKKAIEFEKYLRGNIAL